ncbi:dihydrolipoyl dehydrogenase family protein [Fortiea contorta]|uniref:dihydrolipoyl dehydrogenase family protein n=1 Tax=Fortiea contorta TaxID=1892405 RepID=UPI000349362B|nr:NAD(P)/FAD-dependent oxidoreductase [Fortiea contorta]
MTLDYDVVIIGGSPVARYAALSANQIRAKVALVEPNINYGFLDHLVVREIGKLRRQLGDSAGIGIQHPQLDIFNESSMVVDWTEAMLYARGVRDNLAEQNSIAVLAAQGVDIIFGNGQFVSSPRLAFAVSSRLLRGRTYLLASGSRPAIPEIEGLSATGYLTLDNIWSSLSAVPNQVPQNWVIIGGAPPGLEVAQTLTRLGCRVTLIVEHPHILPFVDPAIARLVQAQLEVDGVRVITQTSVTQVMRIDDKKWVQAGDKAIETDEIIVATGQQPNIESLNLAAVGVKWRGRRLVVNKKLQTTNPRIYACGDVLGGYNFANIANYEARIALNNALFYPRLIVNYNSIPTAIFIHPMLAQVGLTEKQAKRRFSQNQVLILDHYFKAITAAQIQSETTGLCRLITRKNGEILGAEIFGVPAGELINLVALAMAQKIKVKHLANLAPVYPTFAEILEQAAGQWNQQRLNNNIAWQDLLEEFFHFRRNWDL